MASLNKNALLGMLGQDGEQPEGDVMMGPPIENTGVAGGRTPTLDQPLASLPQSAEPGGVAGTSGPGPASPAPAYDMSRVMGYDAGKFNDPNKHDFKYDTGRVLSQFDPRQGFTPDVINALNKLDYGTFAGSGDKLSLTGAKNAKDAADFANQDWIYALKANNGDTKWNFGGGGAAPQDAGPMGGGNGLDPRLLGADPNAAIQAALAQYSQSPNLQALLAQLGGV